jgi:hypothetical protein
MGNHGGGIPKGSKNHRGTKGTSANSADKHKFHVGDHVMIHAGPHTGISGKVKRTLGLNHVHIVPKAGRSVIAHVKNVGTVGGSTKHLHLRVGVR